MTNNDTAHNTPPALIATTSEAPWPTRTPLQRPVPAPTPLDPDLIVPPFRRFVEDTAERLGVPIDVQYAPLLPVAGIALGGGYRIYPRAHDTGWMETPHIWGMVIGGPSTKKSTTLTNVTHFLDDIQAEERAEHQDALPKLEAKRQTNDLKRKAAEDVLIKLIHGESPDATKIDSAERQLEAVIDERRAIEAHEPRLVTTDTTIEQLGIILSGNPSGMLVRNDEISGFLKKMDSVGHEADRSFYLSGYNPDGQHTIDRVSRASITISPLTISLLGSIQPDVLKPLLNRTIKGGGGDGFLARFQIMVVVQIDDVSGGVDRAPDRAAKEHARTVVFALRRRAKALAKDPTAVPYACIHLAPDAQLHMDDWSKRTDTASRNPALASYPAYQAHLGKSVGVGMRLALLFHHVETAAANTDPTEVTLDQARRATATVEHYLQHVRRLYLVDQHPKLTKAHRMLDKIDEGTITHLMTTREAKQALSWIHDMDDLRDTLKLLEEHGVLRITKQVTKGKRPPEVIELHPDLRDPTITIALDQAA